MKGNELKKYMVIDVGGTAIKYALMDENFEFYEKGEVPTPQDTLENYLSTLEDLIMPWKGTISGVACSMPGQIDAANGYLFTGGFLDKYIHEFPIAAVLQERTGLPVTVENDAKCAGLAEVAKGALKDCKDAVVLVLGTGIGGAIIKDGKIHGGNKFSAGEVSFLLVNDNFESETCLWGFQCGNPAMIENVAKALNVEKEALDGRKIFAMANEGNETVLKVLREHFRKIAFQIYNLQVVYDPERIAIGGGISAQPLVVKLIQEGLDEIYEKVYRSVYPVELVACHFRSDANLIGALHYHMELKKNVNM